MGTAAAGRSRAPRAPLPPSQQGARCVAGGAVKVGLPHLSATCAHRIAGGVQRSPPTGSFSPIVSSRLSTSCVWAAGGVTCRWNLAWTWR